jgi:hypothetical protein
MQKSISKVKLTTLDQSPIPKVFSIGAGESKKIGRNHFASGRVDNMMSAEHFEIFNESSRVFIEDLGSANGVVVNNRKIDSKTRTSLDDGDTVQAGNTRFKVDFVYPQDLKPQQFPSTPSEHSPLPQYPRDKPEIKATTSIEGKSVESDQQYFHETRGGFFSDNFEHRNTRPPDRPPAEHVAPQPPKPPAEVPQESNRSEKRVFSSIEADDPAVDEPSVDSSFYTRIDEPENSSNYNPVAHGDSIEIATQHLSYEDRVGGIDFGTQNIPWDSATSTPPRDPRPTDSHSHSPARLQRMRAEGISCFPRVLEHLHEDSSGLIYGTIVAHFLKLGTSVPEWIQATKPVFSRMEANPLFLPVIVPLRVWMDQCHGEWTQPLMENDGIVLVVNAEDPSPERQIQKLGSTGIERLSRPNGMLNWCWPSGMKTILGNCSEATIDRWLPETFHGIVFPDALNGVSEAITDVQLGRILTRFGFYG